MHDQQFYCGTYSNNKLVLKLTDLEKNFIKKLNSLENKVQKIKYYSTYLESAQIPDLPQGHEQIDFNYTQQEITNKSLDEKFNYLSNEM